MGAVAEEEEEDSWGLSSEDEEDNSVWTECDNFIVRNSVSTHQLSAVMAVVARLTSLTRPAVASPHH